MPVNNLGTPPNAAGYGGSTVDQYGNPIPLKDQILRDVNTYNMLLQVFDASVKYAMNDPQGSILSMNPMLRTATLTHLGANGIVPPRLSLIAQRYRRWAITQQSTGQPDDLDTYSKFVDSIKSANPSLSGIDLDTVVDAKIGSKSGYGAVGNRALKTSSLYIAGTT